MYSPDIAVSSGDNPVLIDQGTSAEMESVALRSHQKMHLLPERVDAEVLRRSKSSFAAQQKFCGAAKVLTRCKRFAAPQFCSAGSFAVLLNSFTTDITSIACLYLLWKRERRRNARRLWVHETIRSLEGWCCLAPNWVLFGVVILAL